MKREREKGGEEKEAGRQLRLVVSMLNTTMAL